MTFDEVKALERPAFRRLPHGRVLRYDPHEGSVRSLRFPTRPTAWQRAPLLEGPIPQSDWRHLPACSCPACGAR